ncbi:MAG: glycosyltransferase family 39 protein [Nitrososphaerota archaeon]
MKHQLTFVKNFDSKKYPLLVTLSFFLIIFYVQFFHHPYWIVGDYVLYSRLGEVILADGGKNVYIFNAPQSAGVFYALLNSFTGDSFLNAKLISLFSGTGIVFFSYYIIRNIFSARIALVGQLFVALSPRINSLSIQEVSEIIPIFLIFVSFYHITKKQLKLFNIIIIGTLLGFAFMFRYQSLIILLAIIVFLLIHDKKIRINLSYIAILILFFVAAASPLFIYNYYTHGVLIDSNLTVSYFYNSEYKNPELIEEIKQKIVHKESAAIFSIDPNLFLKNYFYNLFYHNPSRLFNFEHISNLSTIPPIPFLGLIPVFGGLIYLIKIKLDKKNLIVLAGTFLGTLFSVYLFGDINIHFFALLIVPIISLVILNFNKIDDNLKPILVAPIIYFIVFSITPVTKPDHLLPSWIVFPALSSIFFIEVTPKIISKIKRTSQTKTKNTTYLIPLILLLFVFALNFGHSYKSTENYLYAKTYSGNVIEEFFGSFTQNEPREPAGLEIKKIGDILAAQPGIKDSYVMGGIELYAYYANSNLIGASFQEGPENDTIENYITRKNWSDYELYITNQASHPPIDIRDNNKPLPDYLIYSPISGLLPLTENKTQHNIPKILSDPTNPEIPDNFKVIYHSNKTGMIIYKIIH